MKCFIVYYTKELEGVYSGDNSTYPPEGMAVIFAPDMVAAVDTLRNEIGIEHIWWNGVLKIIEIDMDSGCTLIPTTLDDGAA